MRRKTPKSRQKISGPDRSSSSRTSLGTDDAEVNGFKTAQAYPSEEREGAVPSKSPTFGVAL